MRLRHVRTDAEVDVSEHVAERRVASGRWVEVQDVPNVSDNKPVWVDYAVTQGMSREDAESATKEQLVTEFGA